MYREKDLQNCLMGLIGFRQNNNPDYPSLDPSLLVSSSGLYVQDEHPLLCIENIDQSLKNYDKLNYPAYAIGTTYKKGAQVRYTNGEAYESLEDGNVGNDPTEVDSTHWIILNLLSEKLDFVLRSAANKILADTFTRKKIDGATKSIFESVQIFDGSGAIVDKEIKSSRFVGMALKLIDERDITAIIRRLGTQFSEANPDLDIYVFHSSQSVPVKVFNVALSRPNAFEWSALKNDDGSDFLMRYLSDDYGPGGIFYIGYYEDDLVGQAINRQYDFGRVPTCGSCSRNLSYYQQWSKYFQILPFSVPPEFLVGLLPGDPGGAQLWDINVNQFAFTKNFGLNLDLSVRCDVTDLLCREASIFSNAMLKQVTVDILNLLAYSTRNNVITQEVQTKAMYELNNKPDFTPGAVKRLESALKALDFDMSDLNSVCLPCTNNRGPSFDTVG